MQERVFVTKLNDHVKSIRNFLETASIEEKLEALKLLLDSCDVVVTGCYGSEAALISDDCVVLTDYTDYWNVPNNSEGAIAIHSDLCSG